VASGHEVTVFDKCRNRLAPVQSQVKLLLGDIADRTAVKEALRHSDVAFHLVGTTLPATSNADLHFDVHSNVIASIGFLHACVRTGVSKVVFLSSGGTVYGVPDHVPITEAHPTDPICSYGITKLMVEKYLGLFQHLHGLDYTVLRCANAYGPRQDPSRKQGAIAVFLGRLARNLPIVIWGLGDVVRDYVYVQDIARAMEMSAQTPTQQRVLNIGSGEGTSLTQLLHVIEEVSERKPEVNYHDARSVDVPINILDTTLARQSLGWQPGFSLRSGLQATWQWVQSWASSEHPQAR
jgi:UDP-glucose 4-epimerase